jgi:hypothetical protein
MVEGGGEWTLDGVSSGFLMIKFFSDPAKDANYPMYEGVPTFVIWAMRCTSSTNRDDKAAGTRAPAGA